jgi:S-formylglutathione hydrolase FrmB
MEDAHLHSAALNRDMTYRVILPITIPADEKLPVVWLLHGAGDDYRSWSNRSNIADLAKRGVMLVMPDGDNSYYVNSASRSDRRFQDYVIDDILPDVRRRFPASTNPGDNAIVGISRGGFGALVLGLKYPKMFGFIGSMSGALDIPERRFRWRDPSMSIGIRRTFGPMNSTTRKQNDPFLLVASLGVEPQPTHLYLTVGEQEPLLKPNQRFADMLQQRRLYYTFETTTGSHNWDLWNRQLPQLQMRLLEQFGIVRHSQLAPVRP